MIVGIDPGLGGALTLMDGRPSGLGEVIVVKDMPIQAKLVGKGNEINSYALTQYMCEFQRLSAIKGRNDLSAVVERVGTRPGEGRVSAFTFGVGVGMIHGVLVSMGITAHYVAPGDWKRRHGLLKRPKEASCTLVRELYPGLASTFSRKKDDGRADSLLIALYGKMALGLA